MKKANNRSETSLRRAGHSSLTPRQNEIYEFIRSRIEAGQTPPTIMEIAKEFSLRSSNGVNDHLNALEEKGFISRQRGTARGISLRNDHGSNQRHSTRGTRRIPIVGQGDSTNPFSIFMNPRGMFTPDPDLMPDEHAFVALVDDDGMDAEGIFKGDYVVVQQSSNPENGALVFALVDTRQVIRRLEVTKEGHLLRAMNKRYEDLLVTDQRPEVTILGFVRNVIRVVD